MSTRELSLSAVLPTDPSAWSDRTEWTVDDLRDPYGLGWKTRLGYTRNGFVHVLIGGREQVWSIKDARVWASALAMLADQAERA